MTEVSAKDTIESALAHPGFKVALACAIIAIATLVLHHLAADVSWHDVKADIAGYSASSLMVAVGFTALSFVGLSLYDVLGIASFAPGKVPYHVAATAGAGGYAVSNLLGFSWLTGGAVRFRIYSSLGLEWTPIAGIFVSGWVAFWIGVFALLGLLLALHPSGIAADLGSALPFETPIGAGILLVIACLFLWLSKGQRSVGIGGFRLRLPTAPLLLAQTGAAMVDVLGAALALYVLLPPDLAQNLALFFVVYLSAVGFGILSHAPGGIGIFEAAIVAGLGAGGRSDILAALTLYRLIYYVLPFTIAVVSIAGVFVAGRRHHAGQIAKSLYAIAKPLVPMLAACTALFSGVLLLLSGNLPSEADRLSILRDLIPLPLLEVSHLAGSIAGVLLVVVAHGLYRRQHRAWLVAISLAALGFLASISKGLDWEEAVFMAAALCLLALFRPAFYRTPNQAVFRLTWQWVLSVGAAVAIAVWVGFAAYSDIAYEDQLWWQFAWHGDAPRFFRASLAVAVVFLAIGLNSLLTYRGRRLPPEPIPDRVRELVSASRDTEASLALTGDKRFLLSSDRTAFLTYADSGRSLVAKGDPVGDEAAAETLIWQLREVADRLGKRAAYYAVSAQFLPVYLDMGLSILKIGEVARVDLQSFSLDGSSRRDFRHARSRAAREGYVFEVVRAGDLDPLWQQLRGVSDAWLDAKQGAEKGFSIGAFREDYLRNFDHAVLRHGASDRIAAFANLLQGADRHELSVDLMRYDPEQAGFAMDALFAGILGWGREQGFRWFSLGTAPLSGLQDHPLATVWNRLGNYIYRHGEHFYRFEGLREFKEKFEPVWTPSYLASPRGFNTPLVLYEVNVLISGGLTGLIK